MTGWRGGLILLALWGMDLSWLYAWAGVITLAGFGAPFSQSAAIWISGSATLLTLSLRHKGGRNYQLVGAHAAGLALACCAVMYGLEQPGQSFYLFSWLLEYLARPKSPGLWLLLIVSLIWVIVFWIAGTRLVLISRDHITVSNHFDIGVISLVLLHLLEMLLAEKGGIILIDLSLPRVLFVFFIFSVLAFCLVRCHGQGKSDFIVGFRGIGVVLTFMSLLLLLGSGVVALCLPFLTVAAKTGVTVLQTLAAPLGNILVRLMTFLFGHGKVLSDQAGSKALSNSGIQVASAMQEEGWGELVQKILVYMTAGLLGCVLLLLVCVCVWQLAWWMTQKVDKVQTGPSPFQLLKTLLSKFFGYLFALVVNLQGVWHQTADPVQLYLALTYWGGRSGLKLRPAETPKQYGERLSGSFPAMTKEIRAIIIAHDQVVYGQRCDCAEPVQRARSACRRLYSLRHWPTRLKNLLFR